jgi:GNAT superfamily N-acetyltransferase
MQKSRHIRLAGQPNVGRTRFARAEESILVIKELSNELINDWFDFFENRAFEDNEEWRGCYCTAFYYPKPEEYPSITNRRKDYAKWLIETGRMCGYLAYENGKVVGWVNSNDKTKYPRLSDIVKNEEKVLSIVCFLIEKEHRGKGIARKLLSSIIKDAKGRGYSIIEAYPKKKAKSEYGSWNGPYEMYKKSEFIDYEIGKTKVVRRYL